MFITSIIEMDKNRVFENRVIFNEIFQTKDEAKIFLNKRLKGLRKNLTCEVQTLDFRIGGATNEILFAKVKGRGFVAEYYIDELYA